MNAIGCESCPAQRSHCRRSKWEPLPVAHRLPISMSCCGPPPAEKKPGATNGSSNGTVTHNDVSEYYGKIVKQTTDLQTSACIMEVCDAQSFLNDDEEEQLLLLFAASAWSSRTAPQPWRAIVMVVHVA